MTWNKGRVKLFDSLVLACGESAAVYAFNTVASALRWLAAVLLDLVLTSYFGDFPQVEASDLADSAHEAFLGFMAALGWEVATQAEKSRAFANKFDLLGVQVDRDGILRGPWR